MLKKKGGMKVYVWHQAKGQLAHLNAVCVFLSSDFHKDPEGEQLQKKKGAKFKPIKVLKRLSHKAEPGGKSPHKDKTP